MDDIAVFDFEVSCRDEELAIALDAGEGELLVDKVADVLDSPVEEVLIGNLDHDTLETATLADVVLVGLDLLVDLDTENEAQDNHRDEDADDTEGVSHCVGRAEDIAIDWDKWAGSVVVRNNLLSGTKARGIGDSTTHDTGHDIGGNTTEIVETERDDETEENDTQGETIEHQTIAAERSEKARTHRDADCIDEKNQSELLSEMEHFGIDLSAEVSQNDTREKNARNTEFYARDLKLSERSADNARQADEEQGRRNATACEQVN